MPALGLLASLHTLITRLDGEAPESLQLEHRRLRGGLEAATVDYVIARWQDHTGRARRVRVVVKRLEGTGAREATIYQRLVTTHVSEISPRLYAVEQPGPAQAVLYLEALRPARRWPWRALGAAQSVLERLAPLHARVPDQDTVAALREWDYEAELQASAAVTLERLERVHRQRGPWTFSGALRWAGRVVGALPSLRRQLLTFPLLASTVVHGDLHPGNVVVRRRKGCDEPVLLDWGRARLGSPLEDVSSWLQSLGTWEPEARRRHDTLFTAYLTARGGAPRLDSEVRAVYWLAGASNALSGALAYHLAVLLDPRRPSASRASAAYSAREWVRVLRRAHAFWC